MKNLIAMIIIFVIIILYPHKRGIPEFDINMNINSGGCGYFAKYYHQRFPNSRIINFYTNRYQRLHYMVYFPVTGEYADCNGFTKYPIWLLFRKRVVTVSYIDSILNKPGWNKKFNRSDTSLIKNKIFSL